MDKYFKNIRPGVGSIAFEKDTPREKANKKTEYAEAKWLLSKYGGDFVILAETKVQGQSKPDIRRDKSEYIEVKHPTSEVAFDTRLRQGIMQLLFERNRIGNATLKVIVLTLDRRLQNMSEKKIKSLIFTRVREVWKCETDLVIVRAGKRVIEVNIL